MSENYCPCGLSLENPFCFTSAEEEFIYIDALRSPAGTRFVQGTKFTCKGPRGTLVDNFTGYYLDTAGNKINVSFYADRYCTKVHAPVPAGWSLYVPGKNTSQGTVNYTRAKEYHHKLCEIQSEPEFEAFYDTVPLDAMGDLLHSLTEGYKNHDSHIIWMFGLYDLKHYDYESAFKKLSKAANDGVAGAQLSFAKMLRLKKPLGLMASIKNTLASLLGHFHKDNEAAILWVKKAIAQGYEPAEYTFETWCLEGILPGDNIENAAAIYLPKAEAGDAGAMLKVSQVYRGRMVYYGIISHQQTFSKNDMLAASWRQRAADSGNVDAQFLMGEAFKHGWNVNFNLDTAIHWYKTAVDNGHPRALKELILTLERGVQKELTGVTDPSRDAVKIHHYLDYYKRAAAEGYALAGLALTNFIKRGNAFPFTSEEEASWKVLADEEIVKIKESYKRC